MLKTRI
jgi:hypothetical protein